MIHMFQEHGHHHDGSLQEGTSGLGHLHDVVPHHHEVLVREVRSTRSVHVTTLRDLEDQPHRPNERGLHRRVGRGTTGQDLPEEATRRHVMVIEVAFDQDLVLHLDAMSGQHIRTIPGDVRHHLGRPGQARTIPHDDRHLLSIQIESV